MAIAAFTLGLAGRIDDANTYKAKIRERVPNYAMADLLASFRLAPDAEALFKQAGQRIGIKWPGWTPGCTKPDRPDVPPAGHGGRGLTALPRL